MKTTIKIVSAITLMALFGFATTNPYLKKIKELQNEIETLKQATTCSTQQVLDKDLSGFMKSNSQNPDLNAVLVNVGNLKRSLKNYLSTDNVYVMVTDSYSLSRNLTIVAQFASSVNGVCHLQGSGRLCCPPPNLCDPGLVNYMQFVTRSVLNVTPGSYNYEPVSTEQ